MKIFVPEEIEGNTNSEQIGADKRIDEFLADPKKQVLLILGGSGTGKTLLTLHTFIRLSDKGVVVIHVSLPSLPDGKLLERRS